jgi:uncharacterized protein (TIGR03086 family)
MQDPRELHRRAGLMAADIIARTGPEQLGGPTPCTDWDVRAVINHMAGGNLRFAAMVTGEPAPDRGVDVLGDGPLVAFRDSFGKLAAAFDREGLLDSIFPTPFGTGPGRLLVTMRVSELTIHSWDLATATGQPRDLDPDLVAFAYEAFRASALPRGGDSPFGPERPAPEDASAADQLAAYVGRTVCAPAA